MLLNKPGSVVLPLIHADTLAIVAGEEARPAGGQGDGFYSVLA